MRQNQTFEKIEEISFHFGPEGAFRTKINGQEIFLGCRIGAPLDEMRKVARTLSRLNLALWSSIDDIMNGALEKEASDENK